MMQGSDEWKQARAGCITASMFKVARERLKKSGELTEAAKNYAFKLALERVSGLPVEDDFQTWQMRRGTELEPVARNLYELETGNIVQETGFITLLPAGCSPDGLINHDGGIEIKCLVSPETIRKVILDSDLSAYMDQIQGCMWVTGRQWWDFVCYIPHLESINRHLTITRVERDDKYIDALKDDIYNYNSIVDEHVTRLKNEKV